MKEYLKKIIFTQNGGWSNDNSSLQDKPGSMNAKHIWMIVILVILAASGALTRVWDQTQSLFR